MRVPAHAAGEPGALYAPRGGPVLRHEDEKLVQVRWNNDDRSVIRDLEPGQVEEWYSASKSIFSTFSQESQV